MEFDLQLATDCAESFSTASGLGCVLTDETGSILHSCGQNFSQCRICALVNRERSQCFATHRYGLREAERFGGKYIYYCRMGLTCFTSPILGQHGAQAQITAGPFLMGDVQDYIAYDLEEVSRNQPERMPEILEEIRKLPYVDEKRVNALAELLFMSVAFLNHVSEANRLLESGHSAQIQSQISDYLFRLKRGDAPEPYPYRDEKRFLQSLARGDREQALAMLNELLGHILFESGGDMAQIHNRVYELLIVSSRAVIESGGDPVSIDGLVQKYRQQMPRLRDMEELSLWLSEAVRSLISDQLINRNARHSDLIYRTIQYLQNHYASKLTLDEVANSVHISPTYLSRVFKREVGSSMVDFLNRIRIEKSKELLVDESARLIEVALQCGFESQSYFNRMFKQQCGMTPRQYRKLMVNQ